MRAHYIAEDLDRQLVAEIAEELIRGAEALLARWAAFEEYCRGGEVVQLPRRPPPVDVPDAA